MSITSPVIPWIIGILAVVVFAAVVLGLPRLRRRSSRTVLRAAQTLVLNALVIALCFTLLNNNFIFFSSWADMLGTGGPASSASSGGPAAAATQTTVSGSGLAGARGSADYRLPQAGQRMQSYMVRDSASAKSMRVLVYLPKGYDPTSSTEYPVIMGYHGYPSTPVSFTKINFLSQIDALTDAGKMHKSIVVIPQINNPERLDTECVNGGPGQPQTETWLTREVPDWTVNHFHVRTERSSWATLGYSFGGWCAAAMTMRHPDVFSAALSFAGYYTPEFAKKYQPLSPTQMHEHDLIAQAKASPPPVAIWLFASRQDPLATPSSQDFARAAASPLSVTSVFVPVGGHRNEVYEPYTAQALTWLAKSASGFAP